MSRTPATDDREAVHLLFRGAAEVSKTLRLVAGAFDFVAAGIGAAAVLWAAQSGAAGRTLLILVLIVAATITRAAADGVHGFADRCRRISIRAYAVGGTVSAQERSEAESDAPPLSVLFAGMLPAQSMDEYYEPTLAEGEPRLREVYAHSAFYSWRLLRASSLVFLSQAIAAGALGGTVIYSLAAAPHAPRFAAKILEVVCSLIFAVMCLRWFELSLRMAQAWMSFRALCDRLVAKPAPAGNDLRDLVESYDIERAGCPQTPTWLYRCMRGRLQVQWHILRRALS